MQSSNLYVGNISFTMTSDDLKNLFSAYGNVKDAKVIGDRGFGFVEMETAEGAAKAIEALNETEHDGRTIKVNNAKPREERGSRNDYQKRDFRRSGR